MTSLYTFLEYPFLITSTLYWIITNSSLSFKYYIMHCCVYLEIYGQYSQASKHRLLTANNEENIRWHFFNTVYMLHKTSANNPQMQHKCKHSMNIYYHRHTQRTCAKLRQILKINWQQRLPEAPWTNQAYKSFCKNGPLYLSPTLRLWSKIKH